MGKVKTLRFLVPAGKATPGPPIGPALGPTGAKTPQVVQKINEVTKKYEGMSVNVLVGIDLETKEFTVEVVPPSVSALLLRSVKAEKGPATPHTQKMGDVSMDFIKELARDKLSNMNTHSLVAAVKSILGTCRSIGITVQGKDPKELIANLDKLGLVEV
jgi:large subunit ribosomal protein L11